MTAMMTRAEREEIGKVIRAREKLLKSYAKERSMTMLAEFEAMLARDYEWDEQATWAKAHAEVEAATKAAKEAVARTCDELGIPRPFRPAIEFYWRGRGQNAAKARRDELRKVAEARAEMAEKQARVKIEQMSLEAQVLLTTHGLESKAAKKFLDDLPDIKSLMPPLGLDEVKQLALGERQTRFRHLAQYGYTYEREDEDDATT